MKAYIHFCVYTERNSINTNTYRSKDLFRIKFVEQHRKHIVVCGPFARQRQRNKPLVSNGSANNDRC
jgi:hypothetical protein